MIKFLLQRPIAVLMAFTACFIVGLVTYFTIPVSLLPDIAIPEITVQVSGQNTSARELENTVVKTIRQQLMQVASLRDIHSETRDGAAIIRLNFDFGTNTDLAFIEVNEKIDAAMNYLPREVERPRVIKASATDIPVFCLNLTLKGESGKVKGESEIQLLVDATDPNEATQLSAYATQIAVESGKLKVESENANSNAKQLSPFIFHLSTGKGIVPTISLLYNPQMKGAYNFVPGVMGLILILICAMMTSVGIVKEKEIGTMEVLLVSPMKPVYIILAKATPYLLLSLVNIATILALSYFLLDVPINGSLPLLVCVSVLYALVALCLGLLISTIADTQQAAMLISAVVLMLPIILLSGMMFPIENMPVILQVISNIVPAKWYIIAVKDIMIKGLGFGSVLQEVGVLVLMAVVLIGLSVKRFKIRL